MTENWYAEYAFRSGTVFVQDVSKEEPELVADDIRSEEDARLIAAAPVQNQALRALRALMEGDPSPAREFASEYDIDDPWEQEDDLPRAQRIACRISEYALNEAEPQS